MNDMNVENVRRDQVVGTASVKSLYASFARDNKGVQVASLKVFARNLLTNGSSEEQDLARTWFDNKRGVLERVAQKERIKNKGSRIALEKQATKQARSKKAGPGKAKVAAPAA